jgi:TonB family protein
VLVRRYIGVAGVFLIAVSVLAQAPAEHAPYGGVREWVDGAHILPIPKAPFTANAVIETSKSLSDGTTIAKKTWNVIARDSSGRTHNEGRQLLNTTDSSEPRLSFISIADPNTRTRSTVYPAQRTVRTYHLGPPPTKFPSTPPPPAGVVLSKLDLGESTIEGLPVHGTRETRSYGAAVVGNDKPFDVIDEFWYSPDMQLNVLVRHNDPRSGTQSVRITEISRAEPDSALFQIPADFKQVDEGSPSSAAALAARGITPPKKISGATPQYSEAARKEQVQGSVLLSALVGEDGTVQDVKLETSLHPDLDQAAMDAVRSWRFEPAMKDGAPIPLNIHIGLSFHLGRPAR